MFYRNSRLHMRPCRSRVFFVVFLVVFYLDILSLANSQVQNLCMINVSSTKEEMASKRYHEFGLAWWKKTYYVVNHE